MHVFKSSGENRTKRPATLLVAVVFAAAGAHAQDNASLGGPLGNTTRSRITQRVDNRQRTVLRGHIHREARPENDRGRVSPALNLSYVTLMFSQSDSQQAELEQLLTEQQTPGSSDFHHWITPEEYAERFGITEDDLNKIVAWLQGQGLTIAEIARGRNWVAVNGSAAQMETAFQTEIHEYVVNGETHFANAADPSVPAAFAGVVGAIRGLHDFRAKPAKRTPHSEASDSGATPSYTSASGNHYLAPNDLAKIYNLTPLYAAGINGSGQTMVVAGQTQIHLSDIQQFRSSYNLPASDPQILLVPNSRDPGISSSDLAEADLDLEWAGAVARNSTIIYVYAYDVMQAVQYAINQNLAPVITVSYGSCELEDASEATALRSWARQANAQGITWFSASGDNGGADCGDAQNNGLAVDLPASIPEVTGVGGTEFMEGSAQYWSTTNDSNSASVLSYIPEKAWNDSAADGEPSATGGGASVLFAKPSWQTGPGVPSDNARHVPDVALSASADHDGYLVYTGGTQAVYGGTSAPTPAFAGIAILLNQYLIGVGAQSTAGLGNINPKLYALAQAAPDAFHDTTAGDNIVTVSCGRRARNCTPMPVGYTAGVGYDQTTGLGSVDAYKLVSKWNGAAGFTTPSNVSITLLSNLTTFSSADVVFLIARATGADGVTPSGLVQFTSGDTQLGSAALVGSAGAATATLAVNGSQLPLGSATITASYSGTVSDSVKAAVTVSIRAGSGSVGAPVVSSMTNGASFTQGYAPGMILSVFGSQLASSPMTASSVPLPLSMGGVAVTINDVAAPLYYISPGQLNIQIPYETTANGTAKLTINNNGKVSSQSFSVAAVAPGIFADQTRTVLPVASATRGQISTVYVTGTGILNPAVFTGDAPHTGTPVSSLPKPAQSTTVTVGGVSAPIDFIGDPTGLVGVTQINYRVPTGIATGTQPVVVTAGTVSSAPANVNVAK